MEADIIHSEGQEREHFVSQRIVVKIGSEAITGGNGSVDRAFMDSIATQVAQLFRAGVQVQIVTSGAVACGKKCIPDYDGGILHKQMAAAAGQPELISAWQEVLWQYTIPIFQVLITQNTLGRAVDILSELMKIGIPIVNENDVISLFEMSQLGQQADNDTSAGLLAQATGADTVFLLTNTAVLDVDGNGVNSIDPTQWPRNDIQFTGSSSLGTGGMESKHNVAMQLAQCGIRAIIADAREPDLIIYGARGEVVGTTYTGN